MARPAKPIDESTYAGRFAARLRTLREKAGLTGEQMAQAITEAGYECTKATWHSWESSRTETPIRALPAMAKVLRRTPRSLLPEK